MHEITGDGRVAANVASSGLECDEVLRTKLVEESPLVLIGGPHQATQHVEVIFTFTVLVPQVDQQADYIEIDETGAKFSQLPGKHGTQSRPMGMGHIAKGPRVTHLDFAGSSAVEITVVHKVGALGGSTHTSMRRVNGVALPSLALDGRIPRSRLEVMANGVVVYRRPFAPPGRIEVYGSGRAAWTRLPIGYKQVLVTLVPDFPGADRIIAIDPTGHPWFQQALL